MAEFTVGNIVAIEKPQNAMEKSLVKKDKDRVFFVAEVFVAPDGETYAKCADQWGIWWIHTSSLRHVGPLYFGAKRNPAEPKQPVAVDQVVMTIWALFESRYPDDEGDNLNPIHVEKNKNGRWVIGYDDWVWSYGLNDTYTYSPKTKKWEVYLGDVGITRRGWSTAAVLHRVDRTMDPTMTRSNPEQCGGTIYNGPDKRFGRCSVCGRIDYELNEGDRCRYPRLPEKKRRRRAKR